MVAVRTLVLVLTLGGVLCLEWATGLSWGALDSSSPGTVSPSSRISPPTGSDMSAISELRDRVQQHPGQSEPLVELAKALESIGDLEGAIREYTEALRIDPNHAEAFYLLSNARRTLHSQGTISDQVSAQIERDVNPDYPQSTPYDQGEEWVARGRYPEAIAQFRRGVLANPADSQTRLALAEALFKFGDLDGSLEELRSLLRLHPELTQGHLRLGATLMVKQEWKLAQQALSRALDLDPSLSEAQYNLGIVQYTLGKAQAALDSYRRALELNPDFPDAHFRMGLMLKLSGKPTEAVLEFRRAAESGMARAEYFLGKAYQNGFGVEQSLPLALHWLFRAMGHDVEPAKGILAQLRREGMRQARDGYQNPRDILQAFHAYREGLWNEYPELVRAHQDQTVGMALLQRGRAEEAVPVLIREAYALSDESHRLLELIYEEGVGSKVAPFDKRIIRYFQQSAQEGFSRPRMILARIYGIGLGVESDREKAVALLQGHPDPAAKRLLREILASDAKVFPTP